MKNRRNLMLLALALAPASAFAYVDPGSGMLIWQGLLAALGGLIMFVRDPLRIIKRWLIRWRAKE